MEQNWKGKNVFILGLGQYQKGSGIAAVEYFARAGANVIVADYYFNPSMKENADRARKFKNVRCIFNKHLVKEVKNADLIIRHQRIRMTDLEMRLATKLHKPIETAESLFLKLCPCPVVGITGTRGKSTTTTLVSRMLERPGQHVWLGGNILVSPLTFLHEVKKNDIVVLELSSFQLEGTGASGISPHVACVTNLMRDHLNTYPGMEEYAEAKAQIFRHQRVSDTAIFNADDSYGKIWMKEAPGMVRSFAMKKSARADAWIAEGALWMKDGKKVQKLASIAALKVRGEHLYRNMLAASLTAYASGARINDIRKVLKSFTGLPDRQEILKTIRGVTYINDTTATTPDGTIAALRTFGTQFKTIRLILGGADKELEFGDLAKLLKKVRPDIALLYGTAHGKLTKALQKERVPYQDVETLQEGFAALQGRAQKGDAVLLSPGCASFGLFANEFHRGEVFKTLVSSLDGTGKNR